METQDVAVRCFLHISNFSVSVAAFHPMFLMLRCPHARNVIFHEIFSACLLSESQVYPMLVRYIPLFHMMFPFICSIFFQSLSIHVLNFPFYMELNRIHPMNNMGYHSRYIFWLFNIAMENHHFWWGNHQETYINGPFSIGMLKNQRVLLSFFLFFSEYHGIPVGFPWHVQIDPPPQQRWIVSERRKRVRHSAVAVRETARRARRSQRESCTQNGSPRGNITWDDIGIIEGSFRSQTSDNMDRWKEEMGRVIWGFLG